MTTLFPLRGPCVQEGEGMSTVPLDGEVALSKPGRTVTLGALMKQGKA